MAPPYRKAEVDIQETQVSTKQKAADTALKEAQRIKTLTEAEAQDVENDAVQTGILAHLESTQSEGMPCL